MERKVSLEESELCAPGVEASFDEGAISLLFEELHELPISMEFEEDVVSKHKSDFAIASKDWSIGSSECRADDCSYPMERFYSGSATSTNAFRQRCGCL